MCVCVCVCVRVCVCVWGACGELEEMGVRAVFGPGTSTSEVAGFIRESVENRNS